MDHTAALDKPAVVLPVSMQERISEEKNLEHAAKSQPKGSVNLTAEQLRTQQQKMRRASIAVGVLTAAATVQKDIEKQAAVSLVIVLSRITTCDGR